MMISSILSQPISMRAISTMDSGHMMLTGVQKVQLLASKTRVDADPAGHLEPPLQLRLLIKSPRESSLTSQSSNLFPVLHLKVAMEDGTYLLSIGSRRLLKFSQRNIPTRLNPVNATKRHPRVV